MEGEKQEYTYAKKAYKNHDFLNSRAGRTIRIMCEYEEPLRRLREQNVNATVLFFGSARAKSREQYQAAEAQLQAQLQDLRTKDEVQDLKTTTDALERLHRTEWMIEYYEKVQELSRRFTEWAQSSALKIGVGHAADGPIASSENRVFVRQSGGGGGDTSVGAVCGTASPALPPHPPAAASSSSSSSGSASPPCPDSNGNAQQASLVVSTGGGPGMMEAANQGAAMAAGGRSIGMGISLPFEAGLNRHVTQELAFEFHYFFTRKYWMLYPCQGLVACPGGFGTMDELFEVLTLKQTRKVNPDLPVILFGEKFWRKVINFDALADFGVISQRDVDSLVFTDSVDEALEVLVAYLTKD